MRFVITESFDAAELGRYFEADISFKIGDTIDTRTGKTYRIKDIDSDPSGVHRHSDVRVLVAREH